MNPTTTVWIRTARGATLAALLGMLAVTAPARAADVSFRGLLDVVATERGPAVERNVLTRGDSPLDPYGLRLFADATVNPRLQVFAQAVLHDATAPYVDGAYLVFTPQPGRDLHVLAGKLPWAIGTWGPRTYSDKNPLLTAPLIYAHHTPLLWYEVPGDADALLSQRGRGAWGVGYEGYPEGRGMPIVDDSYWDVGVTVTGSARRVEYALGCNAGTPGWGSTSQDENPGKSVLGRLGVVPWPWLRLGVSGAYGPYLASFREPELPAGTTADDYHQRLMMADLELQGGHVELRAEAARNRWQSPYVGDLDVDGGYVELKVTGGTGAYAATRVEALRFGDVTGSDGVARPWDDDETRVESGVGYRFTRDVTGKFVHQYARVTRPGADARRYALVAAALSVRF